VSTVEYRALGAHEREPLLDLLEAAFDERDVFSLYLDADPALGPGDTLVAVEGDRPVACVQIFTKRIRLGGETITLGGIGSVATHPERERRGLATRLLERAIAEMQRRGMALSLLFTGRISFYERLDWVQLPFAGWSLRRSGSLDLPMRRFELARDLAPVRDLYEAYTAERPLCTERDDAYWRGQLRYAGATGENFQLALRDGVPVAYARAIELFGTHRGMEYARAPGAATELAALLVSLAPEEGALVLDRTHDPELAAELGRLAGRLDAIELPDHMWRVLDRPRLLALARLPAKTSDAELLRALVCDERGVYWTSDRF
jgi:predicted N-acetyltransferase YhbS